MKNIYIILIAVLCIVSAGCFPTSKTSSKISSEINSTLQENGIENTFVEVKEQDVYVHIDVPYVNSEIIDVILGSAFIAINKASKSHNIIIALSSNSKPYIEATFKGEDLLAAQKGNMQEEELLQRISIKETILPEDVLSQHLQEFDIVIHSLSFDNNNINLWLDYTAETKDNFTKDTVAIALMAATYLPWVDDVIIQYYRNKENNIVFQFNSDALFKKLEGNISDEDFLATVSLNAEGSYFIDLPIEEEYTIIGEIYTDGTGDSKTKKKGGNYLAIAIDSIQDDDIIAVEIISGTFEFLTIHARLPGGIWETIYQGEKTIFYGIDFAKLKETETTHFIFSVNGAHEVYSSTACRARIIKQ